MGTMPMMQPTNNQTSGTTLSPLTPNAVSSPLVNTVPVTAKVTGGTQTGVGAPTIGTPFGGVGTTGTGTTPAPAGFDPTVPTGISAGISTQGGDYTTLGDFQQTYGKGTGTALEGVLAGLGTATSGATTATNQGILDAANKQYANIQATEAAHGVSADSSTAALAAGDFNAGVNDTIASTDAGIQLSEENTLIGALQNEGSAHGTDISTMDNITSYLTGAEGLAGAIGGGLQAGGVGSGGGTMGSIVDILAAL